MMIADDRCWYAMIGDGGWWYAVVDDDSWWYAEVNDGGTNCEPFKVGDLRANRDSSESLQFAGIEIFLCKLIKHVKSIQGC